MDKWVFHLFIIGLLAIPMLLIQPTSATAQSDGRTLTFTLTVDGQIQTDDPWITGGTMYNEWALPMYYVWFDDNGNPEDGGYDNGWGPTSAWVYLKSGKLGFKWFGPDRQWGNEDDVIYSIAETSPGTWSERGIEGLISDDGKSLTVTLPLSLIGNPSTLEVSFMASPWTTRALDNLGQGAYTTPCWIVIGDATITGTYPQSDSRGDTETWPSGLTPNQAANFDIVNAEVSIEAEAGGEGLLGEYMNFEPFSTAVGDPGPPGLFENAELVFTRIDPVIDFDWGTGNPDPSTTIKSDNFGVRWTGEVYAPTTGSYTFATVNDDGARLFVDHVLVIDDWEDHPATRFEGNIDLVGGQWYSISLLLFEDNQYASMELRWTVPGGTDEIIPSQYFRPSTGEIPDLKAEITAPETGSTFAEGDSIAFAGSASGGAPPYFYEWVSDLEDAPLSESASFEISSLSLGTHTVTFNVADSGARAATDQVEIIVGASQTVLIAEDRTVPPGDTVWVPIRLENVENLASLGFNLGYDPAVAEVLDVVKGSLLDSFTFAANYDEPGTIRFGFAAPAGTSANDDGWAAVVEFKAVGLAGSQTALTLSSIIATDAGGVSLAISQDNGVLTIVSEGLPGNCDGDEKITEADALCALKMYVGLRDVELNMDMNNDNSVTPEDARRILEMAKPK